MKLTVLGCYSATPRAFTNPTAQVLEMKGHLFLIDCGEGTQIQLRKQKFKFARLKHIFISHLHGDHFFGLPGLISTFQLLGREAELHVYGPKGIKEAMLLLLKLGNAYTAFPLYFHELTSVKPEIVFEDEKLSVSTVPLKHRIYTNGFLFKEKPGERTLNIEAVKKYGIDTCYFQNIKNGKDAPTPKGEMIANSLLTSDPPTPKSYAFCSDTAFNEAIADTIQSVQVLYHEATFLEKHKNLATKTGHSTALQAANMAKLAGAGTLILGHYSTRYDNLELFREEAQQVFNNVELADDGKSFSF